MQYLGRVRARQVARTTARQPVQDPSRPIVTVVMSPRERFSAIGDALASVLGDTAIPFDLIVVDGRYPGRARRQLQSLAPSRGIRIVRRDPYLCPNEARNLAWPLARTRYVAFVDNDVLVAPGWLEALVRCAEETGADVVSPVVCIGRPLHSVVHIAGGTVRFFEQHGKRVLRESHRHAHERLEDLRSRLGRERTDLAEFHCMLVRRDLLERLGPLDEGLEATSEHIDLCLKVRRAGGSIFLEPNAVVTYVPAPPLRPSDVPYFLLRWSDAWCTASERRLAETWGVDFAQSATVRWAVRHRREAYPRIVRGAQWLLGEKRARRWLGRIEAGVARCASAGREGARGPEAAQSRSLRRAAIGSRERRGSSG
jgi:hypothetical protein